MSRKPLLFQNEYYIIRTKIGGFVNISRRKAVKMMAVSSALFCSGIGAVLAGKAEVSDQINNIVSGSQTRDADVFLDVPDENMGSINFFRQDDIQYFLPPLENYNNFTGEKATYKPESGRVLIFPSWLKHSVDGSRSEQQRISISFNYGV